jgi:plasmid stabilization system protein ParE
VTFLIEFTDVADMEVQDTFLWLLGRSPDYADRWQAGLEASVNSLSEFPTRCPLAPESDRFEVEVRQQLYGPYRILFTLVDTDHDGAADTVRILHVRHGARRLLGQAEASDDT